MFRIECIENPERLSTVLLVQRSERLEKLRGVCTGKSQAFLTFFETFESNI